MSRNKKTHTINEIEAAKILINQESLSLRKAEVLMGIPKSTLSDHINGKYNGYSTTFGPSKALSHDYEDALINYAEFMGTRGYPLGRKDLKVFANKLIIDHNRPTLIKSSGPSDKWLSNFISRHKDRISFRTAHPVESSRAFVRQTAIDNFYSILTNLYSKLSLNDGTRAYNCDESGFSGRLFSSKKVKGTRHPYQNQVSISGHITFLHASWSDDPNDDIFLWMSSTLQLI